MNAGLVPIKNPGRAKRRLAEVLDPDGHRDLIRALIDDVLDLCTRTPEVEWWIVSDDPGVRSQAEGRGLRTVADTGEGLNEAVRLGLEHVAGADSVTIVPGDVPLARPEDVDDILDTGAMSEVVVVPARTGGGTNSLFLKLPTEVEPSFGPASLQTHVELAERLHLRCTILDLRRLAVDLDTVEDAKELLEMDAAPGRTLRVLDELLG